MTTCVQLPGDRRCAELVAVLEHLKVALLHSMQRTTLLHKRPLRKVSQ